MPDAIRFALDHQRKQSSSVTLEAAMKELIDATALVLGSSPSQLSSTPSKVMADSPFEHQRFD